MVRKEWLMVALLLAAIGTLGCGRHYVKNTYAEPLYSEKQSVGTQWEAGIASRDITPEGSVYLAGYERNRTSKGVHDTLSVRCLALSNGKTSVGIVSLDLIGMLGSDVMAIKKGIVALRPKHIVVSFTHTHSGPDTTGLWGKWLSRGRNERYIEKIIDNAADCLHDAWFSQEEIELRFAKTSVQLSEFDNDTTNMPDTAITLMQGAVTRNGNTETLFTLVNYAVHPHIINNRFISADVAASFYTRIRELGGGMGIFINGAQGNVGPSIPHHHNDWNAIDRYGRMLAETALAMPQAQSGDYTITVRHSVLKVELENFFFKLAVWLGAVPDLRDRDGKIPLEITYVRLGELAMVTIPGEAFPSIGKDLRRDMDASYEIVCGLCNGAYGYIMYRSDYDAYDYHRSMSVGPIGETIYLALSDLIKKH